MSLIFFLSEEIIIIRNGCKNSTQVRCLERVAHQHKKFGVNILVKPLNLRGITTLKLNPAV